MKFTLQGKQRSRSPTSLPEGTLRSWAQHGFGSFMGDYLKGVAPWRFNDLLAEVCAPRTGQPQTLFATGMGELLVWEDGSLILLNIRRGRPRVVESDFAFFFEDLCEPKYLDSTLDWQPYPAARFRLGALDYDECYVRNRPQT